MSVFERLSGFDKISAFLDSVDADLSWSLALLNPCPKEATPICKPSNPEVNFVPPSASLPDPSANLLAPFSNWEAPESNWLDLSANWPDPDCNLSTPAINSWLFWFNWLEPVDNFSIPDTNSGVFSTNWPTPAVKLEDFCVKVVEPETSWSRLPVKVEFFSLSWLAPWETLSTPAVYAFTPDVIDWLAGTNLLATAPCISVNPLDNPVKEVEASGNTWLAWFFNVERFEDWFCKFSKLPCKPWTKATIDCADWILSVEFWDTEALISACCSLVKDW